jgi:DtxR family Mn-dependent transcriptional regulator
MELSLTEENYLKAIYFISGEQENLVNTNAIAERLQTKAATVTDMLRKLKKKGLVDYQAYRGTKLSVSGKGIAIKVLRKHRLWECFLVDKLDFGWEEVHEVAEQLEHIRSTKLTERLANYLGNPQFDPHGDPIPDAHGVFPKREELTLDKIKPDTTVIVTGVKDSSSSFLTYIAKLGIQLGDQLKVISIEPFDHSFCIEHHGEQHQLSALATTNVYVKSL